MVHYDRFDTADKAENYGFKTVKSKMYNKSFTAELRRKGKDEKGRFSRLLNEYRELSHRWDRKDGIKGISGEKLSMKFRFFPWAHFLVLLPAFLCFNSCFFKIYFLLFLVVLLIFSFTSCFLFLLLALLKVFFLFYFVQLPGFFISNFLRFKGPESNLIDCEKKLN